MQHLLHFYIVSLLAAVHQRGTGGTLAGDEWGDERGDEWGDERGDGCPKLR